MTDFALATAIEKNMGKLSYIFPTVQYPHETAAQKLAEEQHAPGVVCRFNSQRFRVEYVRSDGTLVPNYEHYLNLALQGKI